MEYLFGFFMGSFLKQEISVDSPFSLDNTKEIHIQLK